MASRIKKHAFLPESIHLEVSGVPEERTEFNWSKDDEDDDARGSWTKTGEMEEVRRKTPEDNY